MKFVFRHRDKYRDQYQANAVAAVQALDPGKDWQVEIKPFKDPYTDEQRGALWGVAYETIKQHTGAEPDDIHLYFLEKYYGTVETTVLGEVVSKRPSRTTTTGYNGERDVISKVELAEYYTFIQARCSAQGIEIPDPDPLWKIRMREEAA